MNKQKYWVVGNTHVDLAWKKGRHEMAEVFDMYIIRVLDILDSHPKFTYTIEQAAHYRLLARRRPDLLARVKKYVQQGRLEMVGGMASTLETNLPHGECLVRNQALGLKWTKENLGVDVQTAWLIDTFGIHAQIPQLLRGFGFGRLMANRFGGNKNHDVFIARGIDGSEVLIAGRDVYSPFIKPGNVHWKFVQDWRDLDSLFEEAAADQGEGPFLVTAYTENEVLPSTRPNYHMERGNDGDNEGRWQYATLSSFFDAMESKAADWPVLHGDLNPEFTGTFSQRIQIRLRNRQVENLLLEAEKWAAWTQLNGWQKKLEEAWWEMAYIQFHDVFTGSHPTSVFKSLLKSLDEVEGAAQDVLDRAFQALRPSCSPDEDTSSILVFNGLPWQRRSLLVLPMTELEDHVPVGSSKERPVVYDVKDGNLRILLETPAMGTARLVMEPGSAVEPTGRTVERARIENEFLILECDSSAMIKRLIWKESGRVMIENAADLLTVQNDHGSFQIEEPHGAEIPLSVGEVELIQYEATAIGHRVVLKGSFTGIPVPGTEGTMTWQAELELLSGKPALYIRFRIHWQGEESRLRFNITSSLASSEGIYEIPFGTVTRKPYGTRGTSRGEWPAQRFVSIEEQGHGMALINTGAAGVEVNGGRITTTLLRAPKEEYAGMVPDDTSSQHGEHTFEFVLAPYSGTWSESAVLSLAQEANVPLGKLLLAGAVRDQPEASSLMTLSPGHVVLSSVKAADDGSGELIIRVYETAGAACTARLKVHEAAEIWRTNLREERLDQVLLGQDETIELPLAPFEICTLRVKRKK
ncbi:glycoside hydrolase family 38 C-terminal domain-containing protein [Paenibacillus mucilaginosus]|uniref:Putative alpha-mannosidase n=1 Tax=Paenibacillus mucilaginosus (strain KNP414) TaxID=1036673 RepID=F8FQA5_PAEMK|nr:glycoside hydrolase family 38 C-terminal domain-containing protein [Paenibacillus mucilaginosus]AEI40325.1 putative alpha-mannosidase [Paenibacillus mucilaginosus KNP414]MCG7213315.1 glycosyl hydrolase-related protein [Paenibacillus mucilaginosus]WDM29531.1 alpha-mannosidase [Paenibacillus mucilaginosus]